MTDTTKPEKLSPAAVQILAGQQGHSDRPMSDGAARIVHLQRYGCEPPAAEPIERPAAAPRPIGNAAPARPRPVPAPRPTTRRKGWQEMSDAERNEFWNAYSARLAKGTSK